MTPPQQAPLTRRIDELLSSALEDQARDQQLMIETVRAARSLLEAAQSDIAALRQAVEGRYETVGDLLEARLSGVGTKDDLDGLARRIEPLTQQLAGLGDAGDELRGRLDSLQRNLESAIGGMEAKVVSLGLDELPARLEESNTKLIGEAAGAMSRTVERVREVASQQAEHLDRRLDELEQRIENSREWTRGLLEPLLDSLPRRLNELGTSIRESSEEEAVALQGVMGDLRSRLDTLGAQGSSAKSLLAEMRDAFDSLAESMGSLPERVEAAAARAADEVRSLPAAVQRVLEDERSASQEARAATSRQIERLGAFLEAAAAETESKLESRLDEIAAEISARLTETEALVRTQAPEVARTVGSILDPYAEEGEKSRETVRRMGRRLTEANSRIAAMHESLLAYLADRDEAVERSRDRVLAQLIHEMASSLPSRRARKIAGALEDADRRRTQLVEHERRQTAKGKTEQPAVETPAWMTPEAPAPDATVIPVPSERENPDEKRKPSTERPSSRRAAKPKVAAGRSSKGTAKATKGRAGSRG